MTSVGMQKRFFVRGLLFHHVFRNKCKYAIHDVGRVVCDGQLGDLGFDNC